MSVAIQAWRLPMPGIVEVGNILEILKTRFILHHALFPARISGLKRLDEGGIDKIKHS